MMTATVAKVLWFFGIVGWYAIRYPFQRRARRLGVARSVAGKLEGALILFAAAGLFIVPGLYVALGIAGRGPVFADYAFQSVQGWAGLAVLVASLVLFRVTHKQLGRNWSVSLETRTNHTLVTNGAYAWVRHPMYSSFLLFGLAQLLLLPNWIAGPVGLGALTVLFFLRVDREENLMTETFGDAYRDYMRKTARVVPWIY